MYISHFHRHTGKKGKGKAHPTAGHEGPQGSRGMVLTLSLTSALDGGVESHVLPQNKPVANVQEAGWAPRVRIISHRDSIPGPTRSESLYQRHTGS